MTPLESYRQDSLRPDFIADAAQQQAVLALDDLYQRLVEAWERSKSASLRRRSSEPVLGLYLWGGVGRGKTYLMDIFFNTIPFRRKKRLHFHRFMQEVHHALREHQGEKNPLEAIADTFAKEAKVLCLDEFFVTDITDAMLLGGLMTALFARGTTLVTTSNIEPDGLYRNGLQRARFLPAIEQIKRHTQVLNVDGGQDFRLRQLTLTERYLCPLDKQADAFMEQWLVQLAGQESLQRNTSLEVEGRALAAHALGQHLAWFDFRTLCDGPRRRRAAQPERLHRPRAAFRYGAVVQCGAHECGHG
jgi:cell division protein ZapE